MNDTPSSSDIEKLVADLAQDDPVTRQTARQALVALGTPDVTPALVQALADPRQHVRWEAAKALQEIRDPVAAPALVQALEDENENVRWLAAEGLAALRLPGLLAVLQTLTTRAGSTVYCQGAQHVLRELARLDKFTSAIKPVIEALQKSEPGVTVPPAAYDALVALKDNP